MRSPITTVDIDRSDTWTRYKKGMCDSCQANCCTMPVEVRLSDLLRLGLVDDFEAKEIDPRQIAIRLQKAKVVERYNAKSEKFTLVRRADGDCQYLDERTRLCTVYAQRPETCRLHPQVGPRPNYCPYGAHRPARGDSFK
jgi:uncharacterized protein